jgi:hypothetical protein
LRKYIASLQDFHALEKPIVADGIGGLSALAVVAFGAACGVSHGVASKERFDASSWYKPPGSGGGGGGGYSMLIPGIDKLLTREDAEAIFAASGGRRLGACEDRSCCPHGFEDTKKDPKAHFLRRRASDYAGLAKVPDLVRARHFLDNNLAIADRKARQLAKLKLPDEKLAIRLSENAHRLDRMCDVLGNLEQTNSSASRSPSFPGERNNKESREDRR